MLETTPSEGLRRYQIGPKLRALRLRRKMGLVLLGTHTGLSAAMLSKIERGRLFPTLPTLYRIAQVFGVGLEYFFGLESGPLVAVVRRQDRAAAATSDERPGLHIEPLEFAVPDQRFAASYVEVEVASDDARDRHTHAGVEFVFVLGGTLAIAFEQDEHLLEGGDAIYFDASRPHGYSRRGADRCRALVVTTS